MRKLAVGIVGAVGFVVVLITACGDPDPAAIDAAFDSPGSLGCVFPDAGRDITCVCFDGDYRCHHACPRDLTVACTPNETCADFSGGSAGADCACTCTAAGTWSCVDGCTPMQ